MIASKMHLWLKEGMIKVTSIYSVQQTQKKCRLRAAISFGGAVKSTSLFEDHHRWLMLTLSQKSGKVKNKFGDEIRCRRRTGNPFHKVEV